MGLFNKMQEPVFLKESSDAQAQLERLTALEPYLNDAGKAVIRRDIKNIEYGIAGERNIAFELKNSHMAMYILHDIYLEDGDLNAQIDYLVFTRKLCFVIECKNLYGNIEINNSGDFIRSVEFGGKWKKEGIYSPVTQNQRHMELLKKVIADRKHNLITKKAALRYFDDFYKPVVVLANPRTVLNARYAKKDIRENVIRADQLVNYIKEMNANSREAARSDDNLLKWAQSFLDLHRRVEKDYTGKYEPYKISNIPEKPEHDPLSHPKRETGCETLSPENLEETAIFQELKEYRLKKSREEQIKPYIIYNNNQLTDLISKMPSTKEELKTVAGFGAVKAEKYGDDIIQIIDKYR